MRTRISWAKFTDVDAENFFVMDERLDTLFTLLLPPR